MKYPVKDELELQIRERIAYYGQKTSELIRDMVKDRVDVYKAAEIYERDIDNTLREILSDIKIYNRNRKESEQDG